MRNFPRQPSLILSVIHKYIMFTLQNYTVTADKKTLLKDITHSFETGKTHIVMGPNGSGKSTLTLSLSGAPTFTVSPSSNALLEDENILALSPEDRAKKGLFVSFQSPPSLSGITVFGLLRIALSGKVEAYELKKQIERYAQELEVPKELLSRSLNDGFSGGERKKMELLQMAILNPKCALLDEIDTGVDQDALRVITTFLKKWKRPEKTLIVITHRTTLAQEIQADTVTILKNGSLLTSGDLSLAEK